MQARRGGYKGSGRRATAGIAGFPARFKGFRSVAVPLRAFKKIFRSCQAAGVDPGAVADLGYISDIDPAPGLPSRPLAAWKDLQSLPIVPYRQMWEWMNDTE